MRVYAWPDADRRMDLPLLGSDRRAGRHVQRRGRATSSSCSRSRAQRGGLAGLHRRGERPRAARATGRSPATSPTRAGGPRDPPDVADAAGDRTLAQASALPRPPEIDLRAGRVPPVVATAARGCENKRQVTDPQYSRAWTVVGELNNAYNDGTWARFRYGRAGAPTPSSASPPTTAAARGPSAAATASPTRASRRSRPCASATRAACARCSSSRSSRPATTPARSGTPTSRRSPGTAEMPTGGTRHGRLPDPNILGVPGNRPATFVASAYSALVRPLRPGTHTITVTIVGGPFGGFTSRAVVNVVPGLKR